MLAVMTGGIGTIASGYRPGMLLNVIYCTESSGNKLSSSKNGRDVDGPESVIQSRSKSEREKPNVNVNYIYGIREEQ